MSMPNVTPGLLYPLRDVQMEWPRGYCRGCKAELYGDNDEEYCPECLEEQNGEDCDP